MSQIRRPKTRRDGWTPERQLRFLDELARSRSVAKAAVAAGMSREGAYRFRNRSDGALFAALWDRILASRAPSREVHIEALADGRIMRLLGNHFRRERGDFVGVGRKRPEGQGGDPTRRL
jgi:hypothetical protein